MKSGNQGTGSSYKPGWQKRVSGFISSTGDRLARVQGVSFSKGEYTFKGSEIDRSFSFSKLDKCFGDAGLNTTESNRQTVSAPVQEPAQTPGKADSPLLAGLGGLFSALVLSG